MHTATNDSINCIIKIIISSPYITDYQIWYDHQSDDQIHHQSPSSSKLSKSYDLVLHHIIPSSAVNHVFFRRKNLSSISRLALQSLIFRSASQSLIFRLYNLISSLTSFFFSFFFFISLHTSNNFSILCLFVFCFCFCFVCLSLCYFKDCIRCIFLLFICRSAISISDWCLVFFFEASFLWLSYSTIYIFQWIFFSWFSFLSWLD